MTTPRILITIMSLVFMLPLPSLAAMNLEFEVNGTSITDTNDDGKIDICAHNWGGSFHIVNDDGGANCDNGLFASDSNNADKLFLHNVRIVSDLDDIDLDIIYWGTFDAGPDGTNAEYELESNIKLYRTVGSNTKAAKNSEWNMHGWVTDPHTGTPHMFKEHGPKKVRRESPLNSGEWFYAYSTDGTKANNNTRIMKGHLILHLEEAGDWLELNENAGIKIKTDDSGGPGGTGINQPGNCKCECEDVQSESSPKKWESIFDKYPWLSGQKSC